MQPPLPSDSKMLIQEALVNYGIEAQNVLPVRGWNTSVFSITTTKEHFALRIHTGNSRSEFHLQAELALLKHLNEAGLSVPKPIRNENEEFLTRLESPKGLIFYDLTTWLDGDVRRKGLVQCDAYELGQNLGRIHEASKTFILPSNVAFPDYDITMLSPMIAQPLEPWFNEQDSEMVEYIVNQARTLLSQERIEKKDIGIIHKDYILGNCLWQEGKLSVLDFAECGLGLYLYDLATMLTNFSDQPTLQEALIKGYTSIIPISQEMLKRLPILEATRHLNTIFWNIEKAKLGEGPDLEPHINVRMAEIRGVIGKEA